MSMRTAEPTDYAPVGVTPGGDGELATSDSFTIIDRHTTVDGTFQANRDVRIEGVVKGTIECQGTLFVAQGANVTAKVEAENVTVAGDLNGEVNCRGRLQIMPSGRLRGKVATLTLVVNEGAFYEGQLEMAPPDGRVAGGPAPRTLPTSNARPVAMPSQATASNPRPEAPPPQASGSADAGPSKTFIRRFGGPETPWENEPPEGGDKGDGGSREN
ncbi:MAG: bactofilin family protein [Thermomicrobiales bacterium]